MASASTPTSEFERLKLSDASCTMDGSTESEFHTAVASASEQAAPSSFSFLTAGSESVVAGVESGMCSTTLETKERIERSKVHWSELSEAGFDSDDEGAVEMDNREVFKTLQVHPSRGHFFRTFGSDLGNGVRSSGELEVGEKFAEGGQAELFHAKVIWEDGVMNEWDQEAGREWVLKVFKKGTSLRRLQRQWPAGFFHSWAEDLERTKLGKPDPDRFQCDVMYGTLLKDGRFAFMMAKEDEDLRSVIERKMKTNSGNKHGPFEVVEEEAELIMWQIALGIDCLHGYNIIHRDLKASNVLVSARHGRWECVVADFECSIGVVGTGFWRAPEILQVVKDREILQRSEIFSKEADVYAYGMTCYEVLTGKLPFEGHPVNDYDLVLNGNQPKLPKYVDDWACGLLKRCWHVDPKKRPSFREILSILEANSEEVRRTKLEWGL